MKSAGKLIFKMIFNNLQLRSLLGNKIMRLVKEKKNLSFTPRSRHCRIERAYTNIET